MSTSANSDGTFEQVRSFRVQIDPREVGLGDLDGDGRLDVAVVNLSSGSVSVVLADTKGGFHEQLAFATGSGPLGLAMADLDGDAALDLAVANSRSDNVSVLLSRGR